MQTHLGPDGTVSCHVSIAECVDAVLTEMRYQDPSVLAIRMEWDGLTSDTIPIRFPINLTLADPFATFADGDSLFGQSAPMPLARVLGSL